MEGVERHLCGGLPHRLRGDDPHRLPRRNERPHEPQVHQALKVSPRHHVQVVPVGQNTHLVGVHSLGVGLGYKRKPPYISMFYSFIGRLYLPMSRKSAR
eukprot:3355678-Pyramimonas_sp.AAC.1